MGYKIILLVLLFLIVSYIYHLGPAVTRFANTITDLPAMDARSAHDPAVFSVLVRAMYLIALVGIIKLLVSRKK